MRRIGGAVWRKRVTSTADVGTTSRSKLRPDTCIGSIATTGALAEEASVARCICGRAAQQSGPTERSTGPSSWQHAWALSARTGQPQSKAAIPAKATSAATIGRAPNLICLHDSMRGRPASSPTLPGWCIWRASGHWTLRAARSPSTPPGPQYFPAAPTAVQAVRESRTDRWHGARELRPASKAKVAASLATLWAGARAAHVAAGRAAATLSMGGLSRRAYDRDCAAGIRGRISSLARSAQDTASAAVSRLGQNSTS